MTVRTTSRGWSAYAPLTGERYPATADAAGGEHRPELADVGRLLRRGVRGVVGAARASRPETFADVLREHLGAAAGELDVVEEAWAGYEHVNVQAGLDAWLAEPTRTSRLVGVINFQHQQFGLAELLDAGAESPDPFGPRPGNVARVNLTSGPGGRVASCVRCGLYLVQDGEDRLAVLLRGADPMSGQPRVVVQLAGSDAGMAAAAARRIRSLAVSHNVFAGQVLSFGQDVFDGGEAVLRFHERPAVDAAHVVLPEATLRAVERQVVGVARHAPRLLRAGQHLKRGLLLYGPPGVGKTHLVRHLVSGLGGTTVVQLSGDAIHLVGEACSVARSLQPAVLVIEDVDLVAQDRDLDPSPSPLLFQLLNEMDGLSEDSDVVFVLTTNRADLLEPALAARPGRVDQAVELTLPDADARRRLFELYRGRLDVDTSRLDDVIARTAGATASFLKELLRRSALLAAERDDGTGDLSVTAADLDAALTELMGTANAMTRVLLGAHDDASAGDA